MKKNPMLTRIEKKSKQSKAYWQAPKKEKKLALRVGGRTTAASGSKHEKGDVRKVGITRLEHKTTERKSFSVTREMLRKITEASFGSCEIPALVIDFIDPVSGKSDGEVAVIPLDDLIELINNARG